MPRVLVLQDFYFLKYAGHITRSIFATLHVQENCN